MWGLKLILVRVLSQHEFITQGSILAGAGGAGVLVLAACAVSFGGTETLELCIEVNAGGVSVAGGRRALVY